MAAPTTAPAGPAVTAYALPSVREKLVEREASALSTLTVVGTTLTARGRSARLVEPDIAHLATVAHDQGLTAELLLSNYSNRLGDFDRRALHLMLSHPARRAQVASQVADQAVEGGWDGVNVDLERVARSDGSNLVAFLSTLRADLPAPATISIDVSGTTSVAGYRHRGYRLSGIAAVVDVVQLMTYDQHGPGWSGPGPVGALTWTKDCLAAAVEAGVPAGQLDLGVAGYGYLWHRDGSGRTVTPRSARRLVHRDGATAHWQKGPGEWTARLSDGDVLWWSDARSFGVRHDAAVDLGLHGLAVWRLGSADSLTQ